MSAVSSYSRSPAQIQAFLATLGSQSDNEPSDQPPWFEPGVTAVVHESIYDYFRHIGSHRACGDGWFVVGSGDGPYRLFWQSESTFLGRELTDKEVSRFGELSGVSLIAWTKVD